MRLTINPGVSRACTGSLPILRLNSVMMSTAASLVSAPGITSTNFITGTGLKKCMPTTDWGRPLATAISVILKADVLLARMAESLQISPSSLNTFFFTSMSSIIASITTSQSLKSLLSTLVVIKALNLSSSSADLFPFSTARVQFLTMFW